MKEKKEKKKKDGLSVSQAWEKYIKDTGQTLDGLPKIVLADDLKKITGKEPRIMAKFDDPDQRPAIFRKAGYSLLAIKNGKYLLFKGSTFFEIPTCQTRKTYVPKLKFPLLTLEKRGGESVYIDSAYNTGLLSEFLGSGNLYLTIRGRERTKKFDFQIDQNNTPISIDGVQIEVDAGYESENDVVLIEGKIGDRKYFNVRQLYYPFRHFSQLVPSKKIRTLFFAYDVTKATYSMYEFGFRNEEILSSIYPIECCVYSLVAPSIYLVDDIVDKNFVSENNIIPQADDLNKIFELLTLINSGQNTVPEIADYFVFTERQSNYYGEAAESLGLITRQKGVFELTERGEDFISMPPQLQQNFILKLVTNSWYFQSLLKKGRKKGYFTRGDIQDLILSVKSDKGDNRYSSSTIGRRVITLMAWCRWISDEFKSFRIEDDKVILK